MKLLKNSFLFCLSVFIFLSLASGCATHLPVAAGIPEVSTSEYENLVEKKTKKVEIYQGLYNLITVSVTWLDSEMTLGSLAHTARLSQQQEPKYRDEKSKAISRHTESTEFFVSFFTPERKHSDLSPNKNLWKIFLDVNGQRYEGKATKVKLLLSEIQALYPQHNRWSQPFVVSFPMPTSAIENKPAVVTITGALGSAQLKFD